MPANNLDHKPGKLVGVASLADQVRLYLDGEGITVAEFARRVGVSRQNMDNVVAGVVKTPRYLAAMARVMATTVEVLTAGRYRYKQEPEPLEPAAPAWPFERLTPEQWEALTPRQQGALEEVLMQKLRELADEAPKFLRKDVTAPSRKRA